MSFMNVKSRYRQSVGTFTINSTSYANWLDAAAGNTCAVTVNKLYANTDLIVEIELQGLATVTNDTLTVGVNDGTSDFFIGCIRSFFSTGGNAPVAGACKLTGNAAGNVTLTARVKCADASNPITFAATTNCCITVYEVNGSSGYAGDAVALAPGSTVTLLVNGGAYQNVTDGTNPVTIAFTKVSASTAILLKNFLTYTGTSGGGSTVTAGMNIDSTDLALSKSTATNTEHTGAVGERRLTGSAAGAKTITMRAISSVNSSITGNNSISMMAIEIPPS